MRKIVFTLIFALIGVSLWAQDKVIDYYYPLSSVIQLDIIQILPSVQGGWNGTQYLNIGTEKISREIVNGSIWCNEIMLN